MEKKVTGNLFVVRAFCFNIEQTIIKGALKLIYGYQYFIRPFLPPSCRFEVGCSEYAKIAITQQGVLQGGRRAIVRLLKCHGFSNYFFD